MTLTLTHAQRIGSEPRNDIQRVRGIYDSETLWERIRLQGERPTVVAYVDGSYYATYTGAPYWCSVELEDWGAVVRRASAGGAS